MPRFSKSTLQQIIHKSFVTQNIYIAQTTSHFFLHFHAIILLLIVMFQNERLQLICLDNYAAHQLLMF